MNNITCPHCEQIFEIDAAGYAEIAKQVRSAEFESDLHDRLEEAAERHKMEIELAKKEASEKSAKESVANERKITELQGQLKSRGARGIIGLQRKFKIMDDDGSKTLNMAEFKKAMRECA